MPAMNLCRMARTEIPGEKTGSFAGTVVEVYDDEDGTEEDFQARLVVEE